MLLHRNTLRIQSEVEVARAVERWGEVQARRLGASRPQALGEIVYLVRFLTMSAREFKGGVVGRGLLNTQEEQSILFCLIRPGAWLPAHLDGVRTHLSTPRRWKPRPKAWWSGNKTKPNKQNCDMTERRNFTLVEKVFLCLACIFD